MTFSALCWAHLQTALLLLAATLWLSGRRVRQPAAVAAALLLALAASFLPLGGMDLSGLLYAFVGQLSVTSLMLLGGLVLGRLSGCDGVPAAERTFVLGSAAVAGLILYPNALGLGRFDLYALGYGGLVLPSVAAALALAAWIAGHRAAALTVVVGLWAWVLGAGESHNLWDYLIDAWLAAGAIGWLLVGSAGTLTKAMPRRT